ncbi:MAG: hypothetical protein D6785_00355 [Planctomycetota bacterium]|nr:MAG: hypothetical protein D6785_00355 [Planctomycetota bacterium]
MEFLFPFSKRYFHHFFYLAAVSLVFILFPSNGFGQRYTWRKYETPHYVVLSELGENESRYVCSMIERIYKEYSKKFTFPRKPSGKFLLKVFSTNKEVKQYIQYRGGSSKWLGAYLRKRRELVVSFEQSRIGFRSLLFHEGFHQFLEYYLPNPPIWFNEGLAEYFGTAIPISREKFKFGVPILSHLRRLKGALSKGNSPFIGKVVTAGPQIFYHSGNEKLYYAKSWLLVHYLLKNTHLVNKIIQILLKKKGLNYYRLFGHAKNLENLLQNYLFELLDKSGENLYQEGQKAFQQRKWDQAMRLFTKALSKNSYHPYARHYRGLIHFQKKNYKASHYDFSKLIFWGYDWPPLFYYRALCNYHLGNSREALLDIKIAYSLDPKNPRIQKTLDFFLKKGKK